jgi:hypothetical protein
MPDGTTIVIADGVITEIRDADSEQDGEADENNDNEGHEAELAAKDAEIERLQARITELEAGQMTAEQSEIVDKVMKAGGKAWLDKTMQSGYAPAKRERQQQTVTPKTDKISEDLQKIKAKRAKK